MSKAKAKIVIPTHEEDARITAAARSDPDNPPLSSEMLTRLKKAARKGRPPALVKKVSITIRLSPDVVKRFRSSGPRWQTKIDAALTEWLRTHAP